MNLFGKIKYKLKKINFFELGISAALCYLMIFFLAPALSFFGISVNKFYYPSAVSAKPLLYILLGFVFLLIGYFNGFPKKISDKIPNIFEKEWHFKKVFIFFCVVFLLNIFIKGLLFLAGIYHHTEQSSFVNNPFYSTIGFLSWSGPLALMTAFISYFHFKKIGEEKYKLWRILAWGSLALEIIYFLPSCGRIGVVIPIVSYLIIKFYMDKPDYKDLLLIIMVIILFLFPFANICKNFQIVNVNMNTGMSSILFIDSNANQIGIFDFPHYIKISFLDRIDQYKIFSKLISVPEISGDYGLKSLVKNFLIPLGPPRFIWKNKPITSGDGNNFGHQIGILSPVDLKTSIGPTIVGDWYLNFGIIGIAAGMFFTGFLWRFIYEYLIGSRSRIFLSALLVYGVFWIQIIHGMENRITPVYSGLVKMCVALIAIHFLISKSFKIESS